MRQSAAERLVQYHPHHDAHSLKSSRTLVVVTSCAAKRISGRLVVQKAMKPDQLLLLVKKVDDPRVATRLQLVDVKAPEAELCGEEFGAHFLRHVQLQVLNVVDNGLENGRVPFEPQLSHGLGRLPSRFLLFSW